MRVITLTTDFGIRDWFVGTMKGVIAGIAGSTRVIDITHEIPAQNIRAGAFALMAASYFPKGTIHVAVVDPGVGSSRKPIAIKTRDFIFVGPDNGVLSWAIRNSPDWEVRAIENESLCLKHPSKTFHGRDIFAPAAAHLANDFPFTEVGRTQNQMTQLPWPGLKRSSGVIQGEFIYFDHFGNAVTNIPAAEVRIGATVSVQEQIFSRVHETYSAVERGQTVALVASHDFLELAVNSGSAKDRFGLEIGDRVFVENRA